MFEQEDPPATTLACRLVAPFQQVHQDLVHNTTHDGILARAHAENLLNEVGDIKGVRLLTVEECRLLLAPGVHVAVIRCHNLLPYNVRPGLMKPCTGRRNLHNSTTNQLYRLRAHCPPVIRSRLLSQKSSPFRTGEERRCAVSCKGLCLPSA